MSLGDAIDFELFHLKDIWKKVKDDPERLLIGAIEPASSWAWGEVLGKDYEPLVDQMGGAYGGEWISMGNPEGGVYGRAREAGIDTDTAAGLQDAAHVVAALYAGNYGMEQLGVGGTAGGEGGSFQGMPSMGGGGGQQYQQPERSELISPTTGAEFMQAGVSPPMPMQPISEEQKRALMAQMMMRS